MIVRSGGQEAAVEPVQPSIRPAVAAAGVDPKRWIAIADVAGVPALREDTETIGDTLVRQSSAAGAGWRERIVMITSPARGEGKTFVARELATSLARGARRPVLLVDAGLPSEDGCDLASLLDLSGVPGLADALGDAEADVERLVWSTDLDRLTLLGPGSPRPCPMERLASRRMVHLMKAMLADDPERLILIDGPPLLVEPRARVLALFAGQIVLVVEAGRTSRDAIEQARCLLSDHPGVGLILNRHVRSVLPRWSWSWSWSWSWPWRSRRPV